MSDQTKRMLALASALAALALLITLAGASVAALEPDAIVTVCPPPGTGCDYATIQAAINSANPGDTIRVAQGTYTENLSIMMPITVGGGYSGPPDWTRSVTLYETIVRNDQVTTPGDWDGQAVESPAVIRDGAGLKMWYDGYNMDWDLAIGLATSTDGLTWTKSVSNPMLVGTPGDWDAAFASASYVIKEDGAYKMWYEGSADYNLYQTGYATSTNGIDWVKYPGNPVIEAGPEGYDEEVAGNGSVLHEGGLYECWYSADGDEGPLIAYATAPDEVTWTKQGPALLPQSSGWDEEAVGSPSVLKLDGTYWMWYAGAGPEGPPAIGVVTSTDGISWTRFLSGPVVTETAGIGDPMVISDGGKLRMWYTSQGAINYAESDDGIHWAQYAANPVLEPGELANYGERVVNLDYGSDGVVLNGLTLTGGDTFAGGGLLIANGGSALVANCTITDNRSDGWAGGVWVTDANATIRDSTISYNDSNGSAGIEVNEDLGTSHLDLVSCKVEHNRGEELGGMQIWGSQASATVVDAVFDGNRGNNGGGIALNNNALIVISETKILNNTARWAGGGIAVREGSSASIYGTQIYANTALGGEGGGILGQSGAIHLDSSWVVGNVAQNNEGGGIAMGEGGSLYVENSIIAGNYSGGSGGGLWLIEGGPFQLVNCDLVGNDAAGEGGALASSYGTQIGITNTLVISNGGNTGIADRDGSGATIRLAYCDTWGNSPDGTDGVTIVRNDCLGTPPADGLDPLFAGGTMPSGTGPAYASDWLAYDYHLQPSSPAIDTGTASGAPLHDIEGTLRDATPDIGAFEWAPFRIYLPLVVSKK